MISTIFVSLVTGFIGSLAAKKILTAKLKSIKIKLSGGVVGNKIVLLQNPASQ